MDRWQVENRVRLARRGSLVHAGVSLRKRRRWFADKVETPANDEGESRNQPNEDTGEATPDAAENTDSQGHMIPKSRFDEINERMKAAETALREATEKREKEEEERKRKQGEYESLYEEAKGKLGEMTPKLETLQERVQALEAAITANNDARMERIPEPMRKLVPKDLMTPEELSKWLDENQEVLVKPSAPDVDAGVRGERGKTKVDPSKMFKKTRW